LTRQYAARKEGASGKALTIVGAGQGVQVALNALRHLGLAERNVDVFGVARYPWSFAADTALTASVAQTRNLLFVEEHYGPGGMGESFFAAVPPLASFRLLCASYSKNQRYGSPRFHLEQCNLTPGALMSAVGDILDAS
jgi:pyruvate/2-oxoglutarate/acetoin dehydrogenase E1 component